LFAKYGFGNNEKSKVQPVLKIRRQDAAFFTNGNIKDSLRKEKLQSISSSQLNIIIPIIHSSQTCTDFHELLDSSSWFEFLPLRFKYSSVDIFTWNFSV
jgi:hypothetical protein